MRHVLSASASRGRLAPPPGAIMSDFVTIQLSTRDHRAFDMWYHILRKPVVDKLEKPQQVDA